MTVHSPTTRGRRNTLFVVLAQTVLVGILAGAIWSTFAEPGPHGYAILFIALPALALIPAPPVGLLVWLVGRTGKVMIVANLPVALLTGWLFGTAITDVPAEVTSWFPLTAVAVAFLCSLIGILGGWRLPAPRLRTPKGVAA